MKDKLMEKLREFHIALLDNRIKFRSIFLIISFFLFYLISHSQTISSFKHLKYYDIKSCKLIYKFDIEVAQGEKTIIFDDWGHLEKEIQKTCADSVKSDSASNLNYFINEIPSNVLGIKNDSTSYQIDLDKKVGYKQNSFYFEKPPELHDSLQRVIGMDTILGKPCKIVEFGNQLKLWFWNNIILKKELIDERGGFKILEYVTEIDENYEIKPNEFDVPNDIVIQ